MSGDVQPRKRKDKKRKKDELGVEEPRGTAAALGEGDVFMHSQHEHGTGGHWCAKIIFFSLLAVLVTLIGLIILENRGLTDLEANSVESRYSGVLEGWLEDPADDDHHDEHTLELLKQHDDDEDDHDEHEISHEDDHDEVDHDKENDDESGHDDEENDESGHDDEENDESGHDDDDDDESGHDDDDDNESGQDDDDENEVDGQEASNEAEDQEDADEDDDDDDDDQEDDKHQSEEAEENNDEEDDNDSGEEKDDDDDDLQNVDEDSAEDNDVRNDQADDQSAENDDDQDDDNSQEDEENDNDDEEHEEHEEEEGDSEIEVEKLEQEVSDDDAASEEQPSHEDDDDDKSQEDEPQEDDGDSAVDEADDGDSVEDEEFLEADDLAEPPRIVAPKGRPLVEVEDEPTTAKPVDTLAEEEEYEKQQEELRKEQEQASHVWLKLSVGGALLVATYAVVSRAAAPRDEDDTPASEGHASREDTPSSIDRRMTLISEESAAAPAEDEEEIVTPVIEEKVFETISPVFKAAPVLAKEESEEEDIEEEEELIIDTKDVTAEETQDKELYSDEEEPEEVEEEEEEELVVEKKEAPKQAVPVTKKAVEPEPEPEPEPEEEEAEEDDVGDDVEIIDDEQLEEELEEEGDDEEEISDVDDAELLNRLEAKYGRLPEPERPGQKQKDGGNSIEDQWPGEPSDKYWRQQLDEAEQQLRQGDWSAASERVSDERFKDSARARWIRAQATDAAAEARRDNGLLTRAITDYLNVLKLHDRLSDKRLREVADRTLDRIQFRGNYVSAEPVYRLLIRRFPDDVVYRNNLTVSLLMANRADLAEEVIKETLKKWPDDRVSLANLGFILKTKHNRLEEAVEAFQKALEGDVGPATDSRFYYHLGDALLLLRRFDDAHEVHKRGAKLGHFLSPVQRSLYNVDRLKSQPWWNIEQTPYTRLAQTLEKSWKEILKEGQGLQELYDKEKEGLKEKGEWSQLDLFVRGQEVPGRCKKAPVTCSVVRSEAAAVGCKRGQIKFSLIEAGTHVRPHVGPTNCRLRMHLGLSNTKDTYIRVDKETRQWQVGKVFMFDDSFEHEVWHNGTGARLVLIVDVWHPDLTPNERRRLPPI